MNSTNQIAVAKKDYTLKNGQTISAGINFRSLQLMTTYEGGYKKLDEDIKNEDMAVKMEALSHLLYSIIRASGLEVTKEDCTMAIGIEDIDTLLEIFKEYSEAVEKIQKKTVKTKKN